MYNNLRPSCFEEFKGKKWIKDNLLVFITSSINNQKQLDHILFYGLPGTGKTSLAYIIANTLNKKLKTIQGPQIKRIPDLINFLSLACDGDIIFIDEIHAIGEECFEILYSILEDGVIDIKIGKDNNTKYMRVEVPKLTFIGATTSISKIPKPLEERFGISFYFDLYNEDEMIEVIKASAYKLQVQINDEDANTICTHSKGTPRIAIKLLKRIQDYKNVHPEIDINQILKLIGVYDYGLDELDVIYLKSFHQANYLGLKTIVAMTELDEQTIEKRIEPFLIKNNIIQKTPKGRTLTQTGEKIVKKLN